MKSDVERKLVAKNKKAYFDYEILETYETGIVLTGPEVKSIKECRVQLKGSFASVAKGGRGKPKIVTETFHISPYRYAQGEAPDPLRKRDLLLKKKEIETLADLIAREGLTLIPLELYLKKGLIKVLLGVCRGKKKHDKRDTLKQRAVNREINQGLKRFTR